MWIIMINCYMFLINILFSCHFIWRTMRELKFAIAWCRCKATHIFSYCWWCGLFTSHRGPASRWPEKKGKFSHLIFISGEPIAWSSSVNRTDSIGWGSYTICPWLWFVSVCINKLVRHPDIVVCLETMKV